MTKSTITREQLIEKIKHRIAVTEKYPHLEEARIDSQIFKISLAAMDCEPVAYIFKHPAGRLFWALTDESNKGQSDVMPVYAAPQPPPVVPEEWAISDAVKFCKETGRQDAGTAMDAWNACRAAMLQAGNSPVIPEGYVMVPMRLTAENGAKGALSGEFSETWFVNCPECFGNDECETCDGSGRIEITVPVTWTTIKEIWAKGVEHFSATPREVKGE
ncbi:TPA: hypothetical protein ACXGB2_004925 [Klebsiella pneumoniae]